MTQQQIEIDLKDGNFVSYTMRGLKENEVDDWAAFCASVFSYKANPPPVSYFARHYYNDPHRSAELIRVMIYSNSSGAAGDTMPGKIVASCRVFQRSISVGNDTEASALRAGGIGEVCTDNNHRRRGLSKILLQDAISIMSEQKMHITLLHAAPEFFPVYESSGYAKTTSRWSTVMINQAALKKVTESSGISVNDIRLAKFPSDTRSLMGIHKKFTENRFAGSIVRSEAYWNEYLSKELEGALWVLTGRDGQPTAWISSRARGENTFQLRDFGCSDANAPGDVSYFDLFTALFHQSTSVVPGGPPGKFALHLPSFILDDLRPDKSKAVFIDWSNEVAADDHGWMYRTLPQGNVDMPEITKSRPHLIWPADSF
jgi:predicted GNAT family N-acyltransferase